MARSGFVVRWLVLQRGGVPWRISAISWWRRMCWLRPPSGPGNGGLSPSDLVACVVAGFGEGVMSWCGYGTGVNPCSGEGGDVLGRLYPYLRRCRGTSTSPPILVTGQKPKVIRLRGGGASGVALPLRASLLGTLDLRVGVSWLVDPCWACACLWIASSMRCGKVNDSIIVLKMGRWKRWRLNLQHVHMAHAVDLLNWLCLRGLRICC